jgi:FtsP/CotA-like multicopper oxidase with cupredoxin domain
MRTRPLKRFGMLLLAAGILAATAGVAFSVTYTLRVGQDNVVMPDGAVIPVWKIADVGGDNVLRFPGPTLAGTVGDNLVITVVNGLPVDNTSTMGPGHAVSLVVPGLAMPVVEDPPGSPLPVQGPVFDNNSPPRVISFAQTTPAGNGTRTYRFALSKPGTFLYESGADPSVQVGMGIHGALIVRPVGLPQRAYDNTAPTQPNSAFDNEVVLLYSAIDPFLHNAVADNTYGTEAFPSSIDYEPKYFLLNGKPYQNQADPLLSHHTPVPVGPPGAVTLLRFLNSTSIGLAPSFLGTYVAVIGEDGNLLPYARTHFDLQLVAGKTLDALLVPAAPAGKIPLIDRRLNVTNNGAYPGGFLTLLGVQGADVTGPATTFTSFAPPPTAGISPVVLTASASDAAGGNSNVVAAEWFADKTVREGSGNPMSGSFGAPVVADLTAYVPLSAVPADNTLWIRSQDSEGNWSLPVPVAAQRGATSPLVVTAAPAGSDTLTVTGFGTLVYRPGLGIYEGEFWRLGASPGTVTITSTATGSTVTAPVPFP